MQVGMQWWEQVGIDVAGGKDTATAVEAEANRAGNCH